MLRSINLLIVVFVFMSGFCWAQQDTDKTVFYREDQIYIGASFMGLIQQSTAVNPTGLSSHFQMGFVRDIPLNAKGTWAFAGGLGYQTQRILTALKHEFDPSQQRPLFFGNDPMEIQTQTRLGLHSLEVPLVLRWRTSTPTRYQFWRIYGGVKWFWNFKSKIVGLPKSFDAQAYFNRTHLESFVSFGYNTWNFYVSMPLQRAIKPIPLEDLNAPYEFNIIKVGLIFYLL